MTIPERRPGLPLDPLHALHNLIKPTPRLQGFPILMFPLYLNPPTHLLRKTFRPQHQPPSHLGLKPFFLSLPDPILHQGPVRRLAIGAGSVQQRRTLQPFRVPMVARIRAVGAPLVLPQTLEPALSFLACRRPCQAPSFRRLLPFPQLKRLRGYGVQMDVHAHFQPPRAVLDQNPLEPFPVKVAGPIVSPVVPDPVTTVQPLDGPADIPFRRTHQQVVVVGHQAVGIHTHPETFPHRFHQLQKAHVIPPLRKDPLPVVAPAAHMIPPTAHSNPDMSRHTTLPISSLFRCQRICAMWRCVPYACYDRPELAAPVLSRHARERMSEPAPMPKLRHSRFPRHAYGVGGTRTRIL